MFVLDSTSKSLIAKLSGAPATTNPDFVCSYGTTNVDGSTFVEGSSDGVLNGTSEVTLVAAPGGTDRIIIRDVWMTNIDTAPITIILQLANGATRRTIAKKQLAINEPFSLAAFITTLLPQLLGTGDSPTHVGLTLSGLTASRIALTDANKALASNGALTTNKLPKAASSGASLANSQISDDGTNIKITGSIETDPAKGLIQADSPGTHALITPNDGVYGVKIWAGAGGGLTFGQGASTELVRMQPDGKIGIGTVSPVGFVDFGGAIYVGSVKTTINRGGGDSDGLDMWINYAGYNDGATRYRNFNIGNGKNVAIAAFFGSTGDAWFIADVSALTFTDRTPAYTGKDPILDLMQIKSLPDGELDHNSLPEFCRARTKKYLDPVMIEVRPGQWYPVDRGSKEVPGRNIGNTVSLLTAALQSAVQRIQSLEEGLNGLKSAKVQ